MEGLLTTHSSMGDCNYRLANNLNWYKIIVNEFCRIYLNILRDITNVIEHIWLLRFVSESCLWDFLLIGLQTCKPKSIFHIIFFRKYITFAIKCKIIHRTFSSWIDFYDFSIYIRIMKLKYMCKIAHFLINEKFQS